MRTFWILSLVALLSGCVSVEDAESPSFDVESDIADDMGAGQFMDGQVNWGTAPPGMDESEGAQAVCALDAGAYVETIFDPHPDGDEYPSVGSIVRISLWVESEYPGDIYKIWTTVDHPKNTNVRLVNGSSIMYGPFPGEAGIVNIVGYSFDVEILTDYNPAYGIYVSYFEVEELYWHSISGQFYISPYQA